MKLTFEWDSAKAENNFKKHRVSFDEAATVFGDWMSLTFADPDHSTEEDRYITIGMSLVGRVLMIAHTDRGEQIRIISARKATRKERVFYEEKR